MTDDKKKLLSVSNLGIDSPCARAYEYVWIYTEEDMYDAESPLGSIGTGPREDNGRVSWCVQIEDLLEGESESHEQARVDAHNALIVKLENVLAELKGKSVQ